MFDNTETTDQAVDGSEDDDRPCRVIRKIEIEIPSGKIPERLDVFLARQVSELTRSKAQTMISEGDVTVDGATVKTSHKVRPGQLIKLEVLSLPSVDLGEGPAGK